MSGRIEDVLRRRTTQNGARASDREVIHDIAEIEVPGGEITPDIFRLDDGDPLTRLTGHSTETLQRFRQFQDVISQRISSRSTAEIASTLEGLYGQAYHYNDSTREMSVGTNPESQQAKRELDFWVACLDRQSYRHESVVQRLWAESRIRVIMALNSPRLTPQDRGFFFRMDRADRVGEENFIRVCRELSNEGYTRTFYWMRNEYLGTRPPEESPYHLSQMDLSAAMNARFGEERLVALENRTFPADQINALLSQYGLNAEYEQLAHLPPITLLTRYHDLQRALASRPDPQLTKRMVEVQTLIGVALHQQGIDYRREAKRIFITEMTHVGYSSEDAEHLYKLGNFHSTGFHLDDYRARFDVLSQYRRLYENLLTQPLHEVFSPRSVDRYGMWSYVLFNRFVVHIPIRLDDLDRMRAEVWRHLLPSRDRRGSLMEGRFELRDLRTPLWITPDELGGCGSGFSGPLEVADQIRFHGINVGDCICRNIETFLFLPSPMFPVDHALGSAFGLFGIILMRNDDENGNDPWTRGSFIPVAAHEATHIDHFRRNFDNNPELLLDLGPNEAEAYAVTYQTGTMYRDQGLIQPGEYENLEEAILWSRNCVFAANDALGLELDHRRHLDPTMYDRPWDRLPVVFQPPDLVRARRQQEMIDRSPIPVPSNAQLDQIWGRILTHSFSTVLGTEGERSEARAALQALRNPASDDYFLASHPLTRAINEVRSRIGLPPVPFIAMRPADWQTFGRAHVIRDFRRYQIDAAQRNNI